MQKEELIALVDKHQEELIELSANLLKIPSENPQGDTRKISDFIQEYLESYGIKVTRHESDTHRFNLLAHIGEDNGKELVYCGHSDTVPVGDVTKWDFDPFSGEIVDGYLQGRGASDMKTGLAGLIFTVTLLKRYDIPLGGRLTLAIVPDEETGGEFGVPWLLEKGLVKGDGCLIAEPSSPLNPTIGQKGACWFHLTTYGVPAHGSLAPFVGRNAITDAIKAIETIRTVTDLEITIPDDVKELVEISKQYVRETEEDRPAEVFEKITCNIGKIEGGTSANVVPDKCVVAVDCRLPVGTTYDETMGYIKEKLDALDINYDIESFGFKSSANYTLADDPICRLVVDNISYVKGAHAYGVLQWACSDARHFREYNIPVLQYGPAELETIHGFNERVKVADILTCAKVYTLAAVDFLTNK